MCPCASHADVRGTEGLAALIRNLLAPENFFLILAHPVYKCE